MCVTVCFVSCVCDGVLCVHVSTCMHCVHAVCACVCVCAVCAVRVHVCCVCEEQEVGKGNSCPPWFPWPPLPRFTSTESGNFWISQKAGSVVKSLCTYSSDTTRKVAIVTKISRKPLPPAPSAASAQPLSWDHHPCHVPSIHVTSCSAGRARGYLSPSCTCWADVKYFMVFLLGLMEPPPPPVFHTHIQLPLEDISLAKELLKSVLVFFLIKHG